MSNFDKLEDDNEKTANNNSSSNDRESLTTDNASTNRNKMRKWYIEHLKEKYVETNQAIVQESNANLNVKGSHKVIHQMDPHCHGSMYGDEISKSTERLNKWLRQVTCSEFDVITIEKSKSDPVHNNSLLYRIRARKLAKGLLKNCTVVNENMALFSSDVFYETFVNSELFIKSYNFDSKVVYEHCEVEFYYCIHDFEFFY